MTRQLTAADAPPTPEYDWTNTPLTHLWFLYVLTLFCLATLILRAPFAAAIGRYFPALDAARLQPGYAGVRAKLSGPGEPPADFLIQTPADHRLPGLVNLFGIESPGLTSCLAIGDHVAALLSRA